MRGDVVLASGAELNIAPGTVISFGQPCAGEDIYREHPYFQGSELIVRGRLIARGTATQPILFRSTEPQGKAGSWGGVNIEESPEVDMSYTRFEQADSAIHARQSKVTIENSVFRNNLVGVRFHDTQMLVRNNLFEKNGTAIRFHFGSPVIVNNLIRENRKGLFITSRPRDYRVLNNAFIDNRPYQISLGEGVRKNVDLRNNYWGELSSSQLEDLFFDGRVDDWLGRVDYLPMRLKPNDLGPTP